MPAMSSFLIVLLCGLMHKLIPSSFLHFQSTTCTLVSLGFGIGLAAYHRINDLPGGLAMQGFILLLYINIRPFGVENGKGDDTPAGTGLQAARLLKETEDCPADKLEEQAQDLLSNVQAQASTEAPKKDEAAEGYAKIEEELGGHAGIQKHASKSQQLQKEVKRRMGDTEPWRQDVIFHHEGLKSLINHGRDKIKPQFDCLVKKVAEKFQANPIIPPVKGPERSGVKVNVRYGGDASQLSDIVRATLEFKMHPEVLEDMYNAVEYLVYAGEFNGCRVSVTHFHDRYQIPLPGGYKDLLCLIRVDGFVCELQLNIDTMLKIKEGAGHTQYEKIRKVNDDLIDSAMKGDSERLTEALAKKADPNASKDMYGLTALHYVAHRGNLEMTQALLKAGANPLVQDYGGLLPIRRALLTGNNDVVEALLAAMESQPSFNKPLVGDVSATALEPDQDGTSIAKDLVRRIVSWEARNLTEGVSLIHLWAAANRSVALKAAISMQLENEVGQMGVKDRMGMTPLDHALRNNSANCAEYFLEGDCEPTVPFLLEVCSPNVQEVLKDKGYAASDLPELLGQCPEGKYTASTTLCRARGMIQQSFWVGGDEEEDPDEESLKLIRLASNAISTVVNGSEMLDLGLGFPVEMTQRLQLLLIQTHLLNNYDFSTYLDEQGFSAWTKFAMELDLDLEHRLNVLNYVDKFFPQQLGKHGIKDSLEHLTKLHESGLLQSITCNNDAVAALKTDGSVIAWGKQDAGGDSSKVQEQITKDVKAIYASQKGFAAFKHDCTVVTWGADVQPAVEEAWAKQKEDGAILSIANNGWAIAAVTKDGRVVTWGKESHGADCSTVQSQLVNVQSVCTHVFVDGSYESSAFAALKVDGCVVAWGDPACGGDTSDLQELASNVQVIYPSTSAFAAVKADGSVVTWGDQQGGGNCEDVPDCLRSNGVVIPGGVQSIVGNAWGFAALLDGGSVVTWGDDLSDCSKVQDQLVDVQSIYAVAMYFAAKTAAGNIITWGAPGMVADERKVRKMAKNNRAA
eukprot:gnl/MRDRNA2_/MRDRNA2_85173_c0_seq2.p1 gnl/MRDRNA2_/MRDRNA2_85173_c0~~gnl/MRDRNA2_/MRDRNA2_85173_c0_seq2.p1  ORF type:complete len:1075 (-),score=201.63 gnl/MRDRNA2_/MRDRNA2_85173_c0_seq2:64-3138(-)